MRKHSKQEIANRAVRAARLKAFLDEYEELCRKHRAQLHACGCCSSPWPALNGDASEIDSLDEHMQHLRRQE